MTIKKESDLKILQCLRTNARESITNISKKTGIPTSTVYIKIKEHEKNLIKKHTSLIDYSKIGMNHWQKTIIKLAEYYNSTFEKYLFENPNVNSVFEINGGYDYLIETIYKDVKEYKEFMRELEERFRIAEKIELQIIKDLKQEGFMIQIQN